MAAERVTELQRWLQERIRQPEAVGADDSVEQVLTASSQLSAGQRLSIYQSAYVARLLECLRAEYPATTALAGEESFAGLVQGYLDAHPSQSYTLGELGAQFPEFLQAVRPPRDEGATGPDFADVLIETARIERIYSDVFDGPGPEELPAFDPRQIAPEEFAAVRLKFFPCVRLLRLPWPLQLLITAVRRGEAWELPAIAETSLVITRREYVVRRFEVTPTAMDLLERLQSGEVVGAALAGAFAGQEITTDTLQTVGQWFAEWAAAPLFRGLSRA